MKLETQYFPGHAVLRLAGDFERHAVGEFLDAIRTIAQPAGGNPVRVVLEMRQITFIDSKGIGALLSARKELDATGGALALAHSSPFVREILSNLGLRTTLRSYETEVQAAEALLADIGHEDTATALTEGQCGSAR